MIFFSMATKLIRAVNHFTGKLKQPIRLEILTTGVAVDDDSFIVIGIMRIGVLFCLL